MDQTTIDWLLEDSNPAVRYRTLMELLDQPKNAPVVTDARAQIDRMPELDLLFGRRSKDGFWHFVHPKTKKMIRDPLHAKNIYYLSAVFQYLAEFGLDASDRRVGKSAENLLSLFREIDALDARESLLAPCKYPQFIRPLAMLGYRDHPQVQRVVGRLLSSIRWDNGYLCNRLARKRKSGVKSCVLAAQPALLAFSSLPDLWDTEECQRLVEYFLKRNVLYRTDRPGELVHRHICRTEFPFRFGGLVGILFSLSKLGYGSREELAPAWRILEDKRRSNGRYIVDWVNTYPHDSRNRLPSLASSKRPRRRRVAPVKDPAS